MNRPPQALSFRDTVLFHAVRLVEEAGPLDDAAELAQAHARRSTDQARLIERARLLAQRLGLADDWARLRRAVWVAAGLLLLLAYGLAGGLLTRALGSGQTINAALAFVAILGVPSVALLVWLLWAIAAWALGGVAAPWSMGQLMLNLAARLPWLHGPHSLTLLRAVNASLREQRLGLWVFGAIGHAVWTLAFALVLLTLLLLFSFQAFHLTWETTILSTEFFESMLRTTGWLPRALGFPVPDDVALNASVKPGNSAPDSLFIASWLLASTLLYGLVPRLVAAVVCAAVWWRRGQRRVVDTSDAYSRQLIARLATLAPATVVDAEHAAPRSALLGFRPAAAGQTAPPLLIGFELDERFAFPPPSLAAHGAEVVRISGTMTERLQLISRLAGAHSRRALWVCAAAASPDRGAERFLRQVCAETAACALWPLPSADASLDKPQRWADWLSASDLKAVVFCPSEADALHWLEGTSP